MHGMGFTCAQGPVNLIWALGEQYDDGYSMHPKYGAVALDMTDPLAPMSDVLVDRWVRL